MAQATPIMVKRTVPPLAIKPCGLHAVCPQEMKDLWAKAHLAVVRWEEFMCHPNDPDLRAKVSEHMLTLRAAARLAEPVMDVRLEQI